MYFLAAKVTVQNQGSRSTTPLEQCLVESMWYIRPINITKCAHIVANFPHCDQLALIVAAAEAATVVVQ